MAVARESAQQKLERMTQWEKEYWAAGYQVAVDRMDELRDYLGK